MKASDLDEQDDTIRRMREEGASLREIAFAVGLSEGGISHRIRRLKLPFRYVNSRKVEADATVIERLSAGEPFRAIARELGVDHSIVRRRALTMHIGSSNVAGRALSAQGDRYYEDYLSGMSLADIARKYSVSAATVSGAVKRRRPK